MARVRLLSNDEASPEAKKIYEKLEGNGAKILNLYRTLAHSPEAMLGCMKLGNALLSGTKLSPKLRELVILRIAGLCGSTYERTQHYPIALEAGVTGEQISEVDRWQQSKQFTDEERAVLQYADEVAQIVNVKDETFATIKKFLTEQEIVELTLTIGYWGLIARILVPLRVDIDAQSAGSAGDLTGRRR